MSERKVSVTPEFAMSIWHTLNEAGACEAPILAAIIIGHGFEPVLDAEDSVEFYREYLIANGYMEETPEHLN